MSTTLYTEQENGSLKLLAEVEGVDNAALAVDALLDENPKLRQTEFVAVIGSLDNGTITRVVVEDPEPVQPKRLIRVSMNGSGSAAVKTPATDSSTPKRRGRPPGSGKKAAEAGTKRGPGRPPGSGRGPGRPPGSGKKTAAGKVDGRTKAGRAARAKAQVAEGTTPKRRGRPPGSGKKTAVAVVAGGKKTPFKRNTKSDE